MADKKFSLKVTGLGDVLAPNGGVIGEKSIPIPKLLCLSNVSAAC